MWVYRGEIRGCSPVVIATRKWLMGLTEALVSVTETISTPGEESQIVVTCEKFNRRFWRVIPGTLRLRV